MPHAKEKKRGYSVADAIHKLQSRLFSENEGEQSDRRQAPTGVAIAAIEEGIGAGVGRYRWGYLRSPFSPPNQLRRTGSSSKHPGT